MFLIFFLFPENLAIWDLPSDYYMHNLQEATDCEKSLTPITDWIRPIVLKNLPFPTSDSCKTVSEFIRVQSSYEEMVDCYANYYIPNRYTPFEEQIAYQIKLLASPNFRANPNMNYSPFVPRKREVTTTNPSLTGQSSTSSATGSTSSSCDENQSSDEETQLGEVLGPVATSPLPIKAKTFDTILSSMKDVYGLELKRPSRESHKIYKSYVQTGKLAKGSSSLGVGEDKSRQGYADLMRSPGVRSTFKASDYEKWLNPKIKSEDLKKYSNYLLIPEKFSKDTLESNVDMLSRYMSVKIV